MKAFIRNPPFFKHPSFEVLLYNPKKIKPEVQNSTKLNKLNLTLTCITIGLTLFSVTSVSQKIIQNSMVNTMVNLMERSRIQE